MSSEFSLRFVDEREAAAVREIMLAAFSEYTDVLIVVSSQLPAGSVRELERRYKAAECFQQVHAFVEQRTVLGSK